MKRLKMPKQLYFIAILPPENLRAQVRELKLEMKRRFSAGHALKSPAHITLQMPFRLEADREAELCRVLDLFARPKSAFSVRIQGFDCFPPRVIFIRVVEHPPFIPLQRSLKTVLIESGIIPQPPEEYPFHPHMTIATRDLSPEAFKRAWPEYRDRAFTAEFQIGSIFLLKHNGSHWEVFRQFAFGAK
jgi:2'-5' RNA ligase